MSMEMKKEKNPFKAKLARKRSFAADETEKILQTLNTDDEEEEKKKKPRPKWVVSKSQFH